MDGLPILISTICSKVDESTLAYRKTYNQKGKFIPCGKVVFMRSIRKMTLKEIARIYGVSPTRILQVESKAWRHIRYARYRMKGMRTRIEDEITLLGEKP